MPHVGNINSGTQYSILMEYWYIISGIQKTEIEVGIALLGQEQTNRKIWGLKHTLGFGLVALYRPKLPRRAVPIWQHQYSNVSNSETGVPGLPSGRVGFDRMTRMG